ncbi:flavin reductase family protein [Rhodococcus sp. NPDC047139]|uniref:flavin reductase family protein n=1 Tax=Rhodococcus sp. NPDC047139 TaxID=3155141 RepID=UPI0033F9E363
MPDTLLQGSSDGFDSIVGHLNYPMFIVTTRSGEELSGCLVGFATQAGIYPARFLVGLSDKNRTYRIAREVEYLAVHVLREGARELAELFGGHTGDDVDKFARCSWTEGPHGLPILDEAAGWFTGRVLGKFELGDHVGFLLEPDLGELREDAGGLLTFAAVKDIDAGHGA